MTIDEIKKELEVSLKNSSQDVNEQRFDYGSLFPALHSLYFIGEF